LATIKNNISWITITPTMKNKMITIGFKNYKIFYFVIKFNFIDMMHYFFRFKVTPKFLFHNKVGTSDISSTITKRMRGITKHNISIITCLTTSPIKSIFTRKLRQLFPFIPRGFSVHRIIFSFVHSVTFCKSVRITLHSIRKSCPITFVRTIFLFFIPFGNLKRFFTNNTFFIHINSIPLSV